MFLLYKRPSLDTQKRCTRSNVRDAGRFGFGSSSRFHLNHVLNSRVFPVVYKTTRGFARSVVFFRFTHIRLDQHTQAVEGNDEKKAGALGTTFARKVDPHPCRVFYLRASVIERILQRFALDQTGYTHLHGQTRRRQYGVFRDESVCVNKKGLTRPLFFFTLVPPDERTRKKIIAFAFNVLSNHLHWIK